MDVAGGGEAQQAPGAFRLGAGRRSRNDPPRRGLLYAGQNRFGPGPSFGLGGGKDGARRQAEAHIGRVAAGGCHAPAHVGHPLGYGGARFSPQRKEVGAAAGYIQGHFRGAAEEQGQVRLLPAARLAVGAFKSVELSGVVKGFGLRPDAANYGEVFVGAAVAAIVVQPVAVLPLFPVVAAGDDVEGDASVGETVEGGGLAGGEGRGDEAGPVRD